jgi:D-alanyl-D-alanine carboxypeptidase/D-alanyl-D-alanine-endopeptidase (penicillin-binding protein 4)
VPAGATRPGRLPPGARLVATVQSPPVSRLVEHMLTYSDNDLAEALGRLVALHRGRTADFDGEAGALLDGLRELGLPLEGVQMHDSSGLSHDDRVPPSLLVEVLRRAAAPEHPELRPIITGLPTAGRTGTLFDRYRTPDSRAGIDVVHAKSGRLAGVAALAGLVRDQDGTTLVFAIRAPSAGLTVGEQAMDRVAATLARCGCR